MSKWSSAANVKSLVFNEGQFAPVVCELRMSPALSAGARHANRYRSQNFAHIRSVRPQ
jgi:hypothetical protein